MIRSNSISTIMYKHNKRRLPIRSLLFGTTSNTNDSILFNKWLDERHQQQQHVQQQQQHVQQQQQQQQRYQEEQNRQLLLLSSVTLPFVPTRSPLSWSANTRFSPFQFQQQQDNKNKNIYRLEYSNSNNQSIRRTYVTTTRTIQQQKTIQIIDSLRRNIKRIFLTIMLLP